MKSVILGPEDHEFFGQVAELLEGEDVSVDFLDPNVYHDPSELGSADGVMSKKSRPEAFQTLRDAENSGIPTYNGFQTHMMANHNPGSYHHLRSAGVNVPEWKSTPLDEKAVVKPRLETMREEPTLKDIPDHSRKYFSQKFIENGGIDYKIYCTSVGEDIQVSALKIPSKLFSKNYERTQTKVDSDIRDMAERTLEKFDANMLGIDLISSDDQYYAVDVNAAPSYRGTEDQKAVAESISLFVRDHS